LSDLRESGCLTADTRVLRADRGAETPLGTLLDLGARDIPVWSLDDGGRIVRSTMTHVFPSGVKPVFLLRLASGKSVKASANHPFRTEGGWMRLDQLTVGDPVASDLQAHGAAAPSLQWDIVASIDPLGEAEVFDATVRSTHNFVADGVIAHNSIEQDADVVIFLYRDGEQNPESEVELVKAKVAKHRNGPIGEVPLQFRKANTRFYSVATHEDVAVY
ncbi:MAG: DnaB-like helicase C-terminal domain-containing protein, partial [Candidatus Limnocylindria bacterium]